MRGWSSSRLKSLCRDNTSLLRHLINNPYGQTSDESRTLCEPQANRRAWGKDWLYCQGYVHLWIITSLVIREKCSTEKSCSRSPHTLTACLWKCIIDIPLLPYVCCHKVAADKSRCHSLSNFHKVNISRGFIMINSRDFEAIKKKKKNDSFTKSFSGPFSKSHCYGSRWQHCFLFWMSHLTNMLKMLRHSDQNNKSYYAEVHFYLTTNLLKTPERERE